jgi:hypothetical protein
MIGHLFEIVESARHRDRGLLTESRFEDDCHVISLFLEREMTPDSSVILTTDVHQDSGALFLP